MKRDHEATGATVPVSLPDYIEPRDLDTVRRLALEIWKERSNKEYNAEQWTTLAYVLATWAVFGSTVRPELHRNYEPIEQDANELEQDNEPKA